MNKIVFSLAFIAACIASNAQTVTLMKGGDYVTSYTEDEVDKVVFSEMTPDDYVNKAKKIASKDGGVVVTASTPSYDASSQIASKGTGSVDGDESGNKWVGQVINVYMLNEGTTELAKNSSDQPLYDNQLVYTPGNPNVESPATNKGLTYRTDGSSVYYPESGQYDFFGYYLGLSDPSEMMANAVRTSDQIYVPFTIDGAMDLMLAKTDKAKDISSAGSTLTTDEVYSVDAAKQKVQPNLAFSHKLTKLVFSTKAGNTPSVTNASTYTIDPQIIEKKNGGEYTVPEEDKNEEGMVSTGIYVDKIEVYSARNGKMYVVDYSNGNTDPNQHIDWTITGDETTDYAFHPLKQRKEGDTGLEDLETLKTTTLKSMEEYQQVGDALFVAPQTREERGTNEYKVRVALHQYVSASDYVHYHPYFSQLNFTVTLPQESSTGETILDTTGHAFNIKLNIFSYLHIEASTNWEKEWKNGGSAEIGSE